MYFMVLYYNHDDISIHALREEGDILLFHAESVHSAFLSTPSARRATDHVGQLDSEFQFLSTPSARRATSPISTPRRSSTFLSTPSARRATQCEQLAAERMRFLSTPSARRATKDAGAAVPFEAISIHALREEGDPMVQPSGKSSSIFLSTPSARRATEDLIEPEAGEKFLSTPSARRATAKTEKNISAFVSL